MADDLKPMLQKVLASAGKKKFYFAYAAGKRKDGKGDGELAVSGSKPTKAEIEGQVTESKGFVQGVCWVGQEPDFGDTVFFKGSSLSASVVAKMALTAKKLAGRQYDFQIPSEAEEQRVASLPEGDDGQESAEQQVEGTEKESEEGEGGAAADAQWKERHAKFLPHLKAFLQAGTGDIAGVKKLYGDATAAAAKGDYDGACGILGKLEPMVVKGAVTGMVGWQKAKIEAINQIRRLQAALMKTRRPLSIEIAKELESVPRGLEIHPDSAENLQALETFLTTDEVLGRVETLPNPHGVTVVIREPLMKALAGLKK